MVCIRVKKEINDLPNVNIWQQNYKEEWLDEKYNDRIFLLKLIWNASHVLENCSIHIPETTITLIESMY